MRVIKEIPHAEFKITIFSWNNRYLVKLEQGSLEQTFKVDAVDFSEHDVLRLIDSDFLQRASNRFVEMADSLHAAIDRTST
jgi:hypothetical protein